MTENEAKQRWCPMVRYTSHDCESKYADPFINRGAPDTNCIASDCMMWQWSAGKIDTMNKLPSDASESRIIKQGYCGLAGAIRN